MKEIKFRHFDKGHNEMRYSDRHDGEFYLNTKGVLYMYGKPGLNEYYKSYEVEQFTGLKDKNGVDIYEGDIISTKYMCDEVEKTSLIPVLFDEITASFVLDFSFKKDKSFLIPIWDELDSGEYHVVGNIYENPELLTN